MCAPNTIGSVESAAVARADRLAAPTLSVHRTRAATIGTATAALIVAGVLLGGGTIDGSLGTDRPSRASEVGQLVTVFATMIVGLTIAIRRPSNPIGWIFSSLAFATSVDLFAGGYAIRAIVIAPGWLPGGEWAAWFRNWSVNSTSALVLLAFLLFPTGRLASPRWRPALALPPLVAVGFAARALVPGSMNFLGLPNPLGVEGVSRIVAQNAGGIPLMVGTFVALAQLAMRLRVAGRAERQQIKWLTFPVVALVVALIATLTAWNSNAARGVLSDIVLAALYGLSFLLMPICMGIAVLRYRLYDIDLLISRSLSYTTLSGIIVALYLVTVTSLGALLRQPEDPLVSAVAALVVAVLFSPLRVRVQRAIDHVVYGERDEPYAVVGELGRRLGEALDPDSVLPAIARTVAASLRLPYIAIELKAGDGERIAASHGRPGDGITRLPLVYQRETVGHLLVSPRSGEESLGHQDLAVLEALARQAGVAAHGVRVTEELRRARERLVVAREEERRRLLRDLHDELGPRLASQTLLVHAIRTALGRDRARADALLADLEDETHRSLEEVRRIARGLRPPALDELGLADALRDAAERCASSALTVEVDVTDLDSTPTAVETAAYHVAREALANVVRHADARRCRVRLHRNTDAAVVLEIEDDGRGVPPDARAGVGLDSMRERAAEIGGRCVIEGRAGGGTRVTAVFPLGSGSA